MSNILNNGGADDQNPDDMHPDETVDPIAPQEPTLKQAGLGTATIAREPEGGVGTGMNPP